VAHRFEEHELVVDLSGTAEGLAAAMRSTTPDGICVSGKILVEDPTVPLLEMYSKNVTLVSGRPLSRVSVEAVLAGVASGFVDPLRIATVVCWDEVADGLASGVPKVVAVRSR
jgi:alcohol dehydrogenase